MLRPINNTTASCFYAELCAYKTIRFRNGKEAFIEYSSMFEHTKTFEQAKMKTDLKNLGIDNFASDWDWLVIMNDINPNDMIKILDDRFQTAVSDGFKANKRKGRA